MADLQEAAGVDVGRIGVYLPGWTDKRGRRLAGPDEDVTTMAVSAGALVLDGRPDDVSSVTLVVREPDQLLGNTVETVLAGLGLPLSLPFGTRLGGAPEALDAVLQAPAGGLVVAVDPQAPSAAGAVLVRGPGAGVSDAGAARTSVPVRVLDGHGDETMYEDQRLLRDVAWAAGFRLVEGVDEPILAGVPIALATKVRRGALGVEPTGPAGAVVALATAVDSGQSRTIVGVENGTARAVREDPGAITVIRSAREPRQAPSSWAPGAAADLTLALPAYNRAFDAKIGFLASQDPDGTLRHPPRGWVAGSLDERPTLVALPRTARVYSQTTIHAPVPGKRTPYTIAVVSVDDSPVRVLAHVTDTDPGSTAIGDQGALVLRRIAIRQGVSDYGYAFQPKENLQ